MKVSKLVDFCVGRDAVRNSRLTPSPRVLFKVNVFKGLFSNPYFYGILLTTAVLQVLIVQFGSYAFKVANGGLSAELWAVSMILGAGSIPVQQVINVIFNVVQAYKISRNPTRNVKMGQFTTRRASEAMLMPSAIPTISDH